MQYQTLRLLLAGLLFLLGAAAQAVPSFAASPPSQWRVETKPGDTLALSDAQGALCLAMDLDVQDEVLHGYITYKQATARLLLKKPLKLGADQRRVLFEAAGIKKVIEKDSFLQLLPLIRDAEGEVLLYEPYPSPHLLAGTERWGTWTTRYLYGAEAGGATQNIFLSDGHGNAWPDGDLTFLGFELQVRPPKLGRQAHTLYLGEIGFGGMVIPYQAPVLYADAVAKSKGDYRFAAEVAGAFQTPPLRQVETTFSFDPESQADRRRKIAIPLGPDGHYWIRYQVTGADGAVTAGEALRYDVEGNPDATAPKAPPATAAPLLGYLRVNAERHVGGVYAPGEPLAVDLRLFPKGAESLRVQYSLTPYGFTTDLDKGERTVTFAGAAYQDLTLPLTGQPGRDAYCLRLKVLRGTTIVDTLDYVLGTRTDFSAPRTTRQGLMRGREYVKRSAYFRTTYLPEKTKTEAEFLKHFIAYLDEASQIAPYLTYSIDLAEFEALPGVFDFTLLDAMMDAAADRCCALTVRILHIDAAAKYRWLPYSRQRSYDGTEIHQNYYGCYSGIDPVYLDLWKRANRALYDRYRAHPAFQGYYVMMPGGEWSIVMDKPWMGVIAGYEAAARQAFTRYLRETAGYSLETVNARWGTRFPAWEQVTPPQPDFRAGPRPDMRVQWLDFCRFKEYINTRYWYLELARDIRTYDPDRVVIVYAPASVAGLETLIDYTHGGGVPALPGVGEGEELWTKYRVGSIQEPHHPHRWNAYGDPGNAGWVLDWDLYTMTSICGGGGSNLHVYYHPHSALPTLYGQEHGYDLYEKIKPLFRELHSMRLIAPPTRQVAVLQDPTTLYCKHRSNFTFRLPDLSRWYELLTYAGVDNEPVAPARLGNYKLVLPNLLDEVVSQATIDQLDGYVRGGGKIILSAVNGRYCPELGTEPFPLLRRLGIAPPTGPYLTVGTGVSATAVGASPFFAAGEKLSFFTLQNLREDPERDEAVRKNFFKWPYRWIPQTDYFGWYRGQEVKDGEVLARFDGGGVAVSRHQVGKGEVVLFWGTPDYKPALMSGFMQRALAWAGVTDPRQGNAIPLMLEGRSEALKRAYAILWQAKSGAYTQRLPNAPDGTWFVEDLVTNEKFGSFTGKELREAGINLTFHPGQSPLKVLRLGAPQAGWMKKNYRQVP
jgi:hypothetical protein